MTPEQMDGRVENLRARLDKEPEFAAVINELWWRSVRENVEALADDLRTQGESALETLLTLLSDEEEETLEA